RRDLQLHLVVVGARKGEIEWHLLAVEQSLPAGPTVRFLLCLEAPRTTHHADSTSLTVTPPIVSVSQVFSRRVKWSSSSIFNTRHWRTLSSPSANRPKKNGNRTGDAKGVS